MELSIHDVTQITGHAAVIGSDERRFAGYVQITVASADSLEFELVLFANNREDYDRMAAALGNLNTNEAPNDR